MVYRLFCQECSQMAIRMGTIQHLLATCGSCAYTIIVYAPGLSPLPLLFPSSCNLICFLFLNSTLISSLPHEARDMLCSKQFTVIKKPALLCSRRMARRQVGLQRGQKSKTTSFKIKTVVTTVGSKPHH